GADGTAVSRAPGPDDTAVSRAPAAGIGPAARCSGRAGVPGGRGGASGGVGGGRGPEGEPPDEGGPGELRATECPRDVDDCGAGDTAEDRHPDIGRPRPVTSPERQAEGPPVRQEEREQ